MNKHIKEDDRYVAIPARHGFWLCCVTSYHMITPIFPCFIKASLNGDCFLFCRYFISPSEVADLHLISYELERDLIPLILSNCQYSMEKGGETLQDFDLERIQQQVISKFLQGKPLITLKVGQDS